MNGRHREQIVRSWGQHEKDALCQLRYYHAVHSQANIVTPASAAYPYQPFMDNYVWADKLGSINDPNWLKLQSYRPEQLFNGNPFTRSYTRPAGWRVWDSAVCIPAAIIRGNRIHKYGDIAVLRKSNTYWLETMEPALKHTGPIGWEKEVLRPTAPFVYDLTTMDIGWDILEAAHALVHMRSESRPSARKHGSQLSGRLVNTVGEIVFSIAYDLPLDVSARDMQDPGAPDFDYGIKVRTSTNFMDPVLKLPYNNREAAQPDVTLSVMDIGVYIEPHPYGFENKTNNVGPKDHWCCMPTIVTMVGWECVDVILHQPLGQDHLKGVINERAPVVYVMRPADLLGPDNFWGYLALAHDALGTPRTDNTHRYFHEWITSTDYKQLLSKTPPLICPTCLSFIPYSDKAPRHPLRLPSQHTPEEAADNALRIEETKRVTAIVNTAIVAYESKSRYSNRRTATAERNKRKKEHMRQVEQTTAVHKFLTLYCKKQMCGMVPVGSDVAIGILTDEQEAFYYAFESVHGSAYIQTLLNAAKTNGVLNEIRKSLLHCASH